MYSYCYTICMRKRTTIELDIDLLARARRALGGRTMRATVEEALLRAAEQAEGETAEQARRQSEYFRTLASRADLAVMNGEEMWR